MNQYDVTIEVHSPTQQLAKFVVETKVIRIEAGNKKLASLRAMKKLNDDGYSEHYKTLKDVKEVK